MPNSIRNITITPTARRRSEHGHFHTFLRAPGMPEGVAPVAYNGKARRPAGKDALCHFIAIAMDQPGRAIGAVHHQPLGDG